MSTLEVKRYPCNENGRDFVVGDIHGCLEHLHFLMEDVKFDKDVDRLFSVGDLVDRGPKSFETLKLIREPWFFPVQGNHEEMMIGELVRGQDMWWIPNGGAWALEAQETHADELKELLGETEKLPFLLTVDTKTCGVVGICHAESPSDWNDIDPREFENIIWGRRKYRWAPHMGKLPGGVDMTVHGHTPIGSTPILHERMNAWWIDTGCFATGTMIFLQIDGKDLKGPKVFSAHAPTQALGWS